VISSQTFLCAFHVCVFFEPHCTLKTAVEHPSHGFLSGGRDARPPGNAHFQGEKAVPESAHLSMGAVKRLHPQGEGVKPFSRHNTRTEDSFSALNGGFQG